MSSQKSNSILANLVQDAISSIPEIPKVGISANASRISDMLNEASEVKDEGSELGGASTTGDQSLVASSIALIDNPYAAWVSVELSNDSGESVILRQADGFLSMEHTRLMSDKGAKLVLAFLDKSGGCELESTILRHPNIKVQYGYHNGSVSPVWCHKVVKMLLIIS